MRTIQADLLLLQEVDLNARRTRYRDIASEVAHSLNLNYVFGMEFQELSEGTAARPAYHGMATLSPWPLSKARIIRFRRPVHVSGSRVGMCPICPCFSAGSAGGSHSSAEATIYGRKVVTYNLHLESRGDDELRLRQLNEVLADCRKHVDRPRLIVAGDFNLNAGAGEAANGSPRCRLPRRSAVCPRIRPRLRNFLSHRAHAIDWIFVSGCSGFARARCTMRSTHRTTIPFQPRLPNR